MPRKMAFATLFACLILGDASAAGVASPSLCVAENGGHGEQHPPPMGSIVRVDLASAAKEVVASNLEDPVWVDSDGTSAFVGLFHAGTIVRLDMTAAGSAPVTVASGLSCPEGVAIENESTILTVENPVGNECQQPVANLSTTAALTRIDLATGKKTVVAGLLEPHGLAVAGGFAYVCEAGGGTVATLTKVDLKTGLKQGIAALASPSGCAIDGGGSAFVVEEGSNDGSLVQVRLKDGSKTTLKAGLSGPMGVAYGGIGMEKYVYVGERSQNRVWRVVPAQGAPAEIFAENFNSPIGLTMC